MTKELRKKFILINMALVGTVLLIVFGGRLLGFGKHAHHNDTDDLPPYQG